MTAQHLLQRPIYGGFFGEGRYFLATIPCISRGLHSTRYMVVEPAAGVVLSISEDKCKALADARRLLAANDPQGPRPEPLCEQLLLWPGERAQPPRARVSRRRRTIYERTGGKCFYCATPLELTGPWHVEHQKPRALGGDDDALNLVAACIACNLKKGDRTALEFVANRT